MHTRIVMDWMIKMALTVCLSLFCTATRAQLSALQLLSTAWDDPSVQLQREQQAYLESTDFSMPLLRKLEIRTNTRDLDPKQQDYALRISTNGFGMRRTQTSIYSARKELTEAERQILLQNALLDRYELLIDANFSQRESVLLERQRQVLMDKKAVYTEQLVQGLEKDLDDYFRTMDDLMALTRKDAEIAANKAEFQLLTKIFTGQADSLLPGEMIHWTELRLETDSVALPPVIQREQAQVQLAILEEEMERMDGRNLLNYLQFRYTGNANDLLEDRFSFGLGFDLPWPNGSKLQEQELHLKTLETQSELALKRNDLEKARMVKANEFQQFFKKYLLADKQLTTFTEEYSPAFLHGSGLENPETLLRVQETIVKLELERLAVEKNLYKYYIELLSESGLLLQAPARNWLSPSLELIGR
jgi:hypothetical protein